VEPPATAQITSVPHTKADGIQHILPWLYTVQ